MEQRRIRRKSIGGRAAKRKHGALRTLIDHGDGEASDLARLNAGNIHTYCLHFLEDEIAIKITPDRTVKFSGRAQIG